MAIKGAQSPANQTSHIKFQNCISVQCLVGEVGSAHAGFLVVELEHTHVLLLDLNSPVVEWVETVLAITISGVMTCPLTRLVRFGVILKTLLIMLTI